MNERHLDVVQRFVDARNHKRFGWLPSTWSAERCRPGERLNPRKATIVPATATDPYSSSVIQPGTTHGRPRVRRCQTMYVGIMLTVQRMSGNVEVDRRNGSSQSRYHGYTT